jgi:hypothetical protein
VLQHHKLTNESSEENPRVQEDCSNLQNVRELKLRSKKEELPDKNLNRSND